MKISPSEPIAIGERGCRFPRLWELLRASQDVSSDILEGRFSWKDGSQHGTVPQTPGERILLKMASAISMRSFSNITPAKADAAGPLQRL